MRLELNQLGDLVAALEKLMGSPLNDGVMSLPESFGQGSIKVYPLGRYMHLMIHQYVLKEAIVGRRRATNAGQEWITFSFRNLLPQSGKGDQSSASLTLNSRLLPSIQVSSGDIELETITPANTNINTILLTVHTDLLKDLLNQKKANPFLQLISSGDRPFLYDELVSPAIQEVAASVFAVQESDQLTDFYLKLKAQELIYLFLGSLMKRETAVYYPINGSDVDAMYRVRDKLMVDLSSPPNLSELALLTNMSESKLNRVFKQIFGTPIYSYYQTLRMNAAAYLIKQEKVSVSEAGYRLGFTNLSHFGRLFAKQMGLPPKKYAKAL